MTLMKILVAATAGVCSTSAFSMHASMPRGLRTVARATDEAAGTDAAVMIEPPRENPSKLEFSKRQYFYGRCAIELGEGYKTMTEQFDPSWKDDNCALAAVEVEMPLGMVIGESDKLKGRIEVLEVLEGSTAEAAGIKAGDVLRAVSAQKKDAQAAAEGNIAFNAFAGATTSGVEIRRALYIADGRSFDGCMEALATNSDKNGGTGRAAMVFERRHDESTAVAEA